MVVIYPNRRLRPAVAVIVLAWELRRDKLSSGPGQ
jgi:hypothetical protein